MLALLRDHVYPVELSCHLVVSRSRCEASIHRWKCCSGGRNPCLARDRNGVSLVAYLKLATARSGDVLLTECGNLRLCVHPPADLALDLLYMATRTPSFCLCREAHRPIVLASLRTQRITSTYSVARRTMARSGWRASF